MILTSNALKGTVKYLLVAFLSILISNCAAPRSGDELPLAGVRLAIDPGHGNTEAYDSIRIGPSGEREEWINLRVALILRVLLQEAGARVVMTRETNRDVNLGGRAMIAKLNKSDFFISIHHNGTLNDKSLDFPLVYYWGESSENPASVELANLVLEEMLTNMIFENTDGAGVYSDFLIYPEGTAVLRNTFPQLPGIIGEAGYISNSSSELRMKDKSFNRLEAQSYFKAIKKYVANGLPKAIPMKWETEDSISDSLIVFKLADGLGGYEFDPSAFRVTVNDTLIDFEWNDSLGILSIIHDNSEEEIEVKIFGKNRYGNSLHPRRWRFLTEIGRAKRWQGKWYEAFKRAENLSDDFNSHIESERESSEYVSQLLGIIHWYKRSIELQAHHPKSAVAEFNIAELYKLLYYDTKDVKFKEEALLHYRRTFEYYPGSVKETNAKKGYDEMSSGQ